MLQSLKDLLADLTAGHREPTGFGETDYRLAAAALLIHVIAIDGEVSDVELRKLTALLKAQFALDDEAVTELIEAATAAEREAIDLYHFTLLLNRSLDEAGKARVVEMMWQLVYADGRVNEFEDNVIWRAADLLGVSSRERIALRRRVSAERNDGNENG
jgi:uncharacterized tellurite resistance protein B-like protein